MCLSRVAIVTGDGGGSMMKAPKTLVAVLTVEAIVLAVLLTAALDQYVHAQAASGDGLNAWGYRGAVAKARAYDETRLLMVGGTRAFEPGIAVLDTVSARVRFMVEQWVTFDRGPVTAINLALPGLPRGAYADRLAQFRAITPDVVCVFVDLAPATPPRSRRGLVTRLTGYHPALPQWSAIDRLLAVPLGDDANPGDDIGSVAEAISVGLSMSSGVVVAIPQPATASETSVRDALVAVLAPFVSHPRVSVVQMADGPPAVAAGVLQPAAAIQIEPAISSLLRTR